MEISQEKIEKYWKQLRKLSNSAQIDSKWYNSYFFYAMSLAFQNRLKESDRAFAKAAKIGRQLKKRNQP